jgi:hypothetical protein
MAGTIIAVKLGEPAVSRPSRNALDPKFLDLITPALPVEPLVGFQPRGSGNAGDDYKLASDLYVANKDLIEIAMSKKKEIAKGVGIIGAEVMDVLRQIHAHVADGARKRQMRYTFVHTPTKFEVGYFYEPVASDLQAVAEVVELLMNHHFGRKEYDQAAKVLKDNFVFGWHVMNERARTDLVMRGLWIQRQATAGLVTIYTITKAPKDAARLKTATKYMDELNSVTENYEHKHEAVWAVEPVPGDIYLVVEGDKDRAMRVQALLALGVVRYTHRHRSGDVTRTNALLAEYANSEDPMIAAAAKAARELTRTGFNLVGTR